MNKSKLLCVLLMVVTLAACISCKGSAGSDSPKSYTVTFETNGGSAIAAQSVESGKKATKPLSNPNKENCKFDGWYTDSELTTEFDFSQEITDDITIYAKWSESKTYTVSFETNGGSKIPEQHIAENEKAARPEDPVKSDGSLFMGWYINEQYTVEFNFDSMIVEDKVLYAKWGDSWTVTFSGVSDIEPQKVADGEKVTKPATPSDKVNSVFDDWYADAAYTTKFDFNSPITANTTVYAKWLSVFTVTFNSVEGSAVAPVKAVQGKTISKPANPTRENRTFDGWYKDSAYTEAFDFSKTVITRDMTLYAKWAVPQGVDNPLTITITNDDLDVTIDSKISGAAQYDYTFTCKDGAADWYVNNKKVKSDSDNYTITIVMDNKQMTRLIEARKVIDGIEYSWSLLWTISL